MDAFDPYRPGRDAEPPLEAMLGDRPERLFDERTSSTS